MIKTLLFKSKFVLLVILPIIAMLLVRTFFIDHFKNGAENNAQSAFDGSNCIAPSDSAFLAENSLLVYLDHQPSKYTNHLNFIALNPSKLFDMNTLQLIKQNEGKVILISKDQNLTARVWMLLAQKGIKNIYVLSNEAQEAFKYQFQPDTTLGAEELELE